MYRGDELTSDATDSRGNPHLVLKKKGFESELSVYSVEQLDHVLKMACNKKVTETRICLEGIHCLIFSCCYSSCISCLIFFVYYMLYILLLFFMYSCIIFFCYSLCITGCIFSCYSSCYSSVILHVLLCCIFSCNYSLYIGCSYVLLLFFVHIHAGYSL